MPEIKPEIDLEHGQEPELDLLMIVSTTEADSVLLPLAGACARRGLRWTVSSAATAYRYLTIQPWCR